MAGFEAVDFLKKIHPFAALDDPERRMVADLFEGISVPAGQLLCKAGSDRHALWIVLSGRLRVIDDRKPERPVELDTLGEGAHFGEAALFSGAPPKFSVYTLSSATLLRLNKERLDGLLARQASLKATLQRQLSDRGRPGAASAVEHGIVPEPPLSGAAPLDGIHALPETDRALHGG